MNSTAARPSATSRRHVSNATAQPEPGAVQRPMRGMRRDAVRNYERILQAAREVFDESGADACMEGIAARAGVGIGTVYRRFASKDALIDELLCLALEQLNGDAEHALARTDGYGLHELLGAFGRSFAQHARYANLLLARPSDAGAARRLREAMIELTSRAVSAGTVAPGTTIDDVSALTSAMRGMIHIARDLPPHAWQRFLDIHLAGLRTAATPGPEVVTARPA